MVAGALSLHDGGYDVVVVFRYLKRAMFPVLRDLVRPGGRLVYETFNRRYLQIVPQFNIEFLLEDGELPADCHGISEPAPRGTAPGADGGL